jgi:hypothetical protein
VKPKPAKDTTREENHMPVYLLNIDTEILNKTLANQMQWHIKRIIYHDGEGFIPGVQTSASTYKSTTGTVQKKYNMITSIGTEKEFNKNSTFFHV